MNRYSIRDLEKMTGIKAHTIRIWEKRYGIVEPSRSLTNIRNYTDEDLKRLLNITALNKAGFKISAIVAMSPDEINRRLVEISETDSSYTYEVENMVLAMLEMDEQRFDKIISSAIIKLGFEITMTDLLSRFLVKTGVLWQAGTISPVQEHFASNLIRQKLIMAIDGLSITYTDHSKTFLLFLPEGEYHEIALLYFHYLIKKAGHKVVYLGQNVPVSNLALVEGIQNIPYLMTSVTCPQPGSDLQDFIDRLAGLFPAKTVLLGGYQFQQHFPSLPSNIKYFDSVSEMTDFLIDA